MSDNAHNQRKHSLLSASGSERWMNCTPSARAEEPIASVESIYALEGTLAHELSELELKLYFGLISKDEYNTGLTLVESNEHYRDDMPEFVDIYVSYCIERVNYYSSINEHVEISIEEKIDLTKYIEEGFGSNDFVIITDKFIEVIDLKYGRGVPVSAYENSQLKLYGLGSVYKHRLSYNMSEVMLTIVQPRIDNISSFVIDVDELEAWADNEVTPKAKMAYLGEGEFKSGSWCKFCKFKPMCKALYDENLNMIDEDFRSPHEISEADMIKVFAKAGEIKQWIDSIETHLLNKLLNKEKVEGYKLVAGRSIRKFTEPESIINVLKEKGYTDYMSQPKLLGITHIEKVVGKTNFTKLLGEFVAKSEPKPQVAISTDKRNDYFATASDDFNDNL